MKTWFITGANGGLAYSMLEILLERGGRVAATIRKQTERYVPFVLKFV
ncbi:MAG: hypothetical protein LBB59_06330 [Campylobacteraceae bacterium]|jgi:NAD(P)-dependent dehydrogenase (short-subunit alcohol dehydrogenase family)|nr:hypothetical protein [Campylobacteraceae bacterium]